MLNDLKQELIKYGRISGQKGFTPGISGNFSARAGEKILITASGSSNGFLEENEKLLVKDFYTLNFTNKDRI